MSETILWLVLLVALVNLALLVVGVRRWGRGGRDRPEALRDELRVAREEAARAAAASRDELAKGLRSGNATLALTLKSMGEVQHAQLAGLSASLKQLSESNHASLERVRATVDARVRELQDGNEKKLEEMRRTVDEKLQTTLEKRLGESFKLVSAQLESVQKGLGEMQSLASGVGDLKRVLTNVKARGTWAEVQLGALLGETLAPGQFEKNVHVEPGSREVVEFAVKLPGPKDEPDVCVWLPIDSKLPQEDYMRIQDAADCGDCEATQRATDALARAIRLAAQDIHDKYVKPPHTTDFAIMFLPPRDSTPRWCGSRRSSTSCSIATALSWLDPPRWRRCSAACAWGSRRWPSSSAPWRSGACSARSRRSSASSARCSTR
jgi:DNA recombination protein RmuC